MTANALLLLLYHDLLQGILVSIGTSRDQNCLNCANNHSPIHAGHVLTALRLHACVGLQLDMRAKQQHWLSSRTHLPCPLAAGPRFPASTMRNILARPSQLGTSKAMITDMCECASIYDSWLLQRCQALSSGRNSSTVSQDDNAALSHMLTSKRNQVLHCQSTPCNSLCLVSHLHRVLHVPSPTQAHCKRLHRQAP